MKISKLFHWLYAILMFLPILVFIPNAFYYGFNKEAVAQEKTELVPVYYESNEVTSINDLVEGNVYRIYRNNVVDQRFDLTGILVTDMWVNGTYQVYNNVVDYNRPYVEIVPNGTSNSFLLFHKLSQSKYYMTSGYIDFVYNLYNGSSTFWQFVSKCDSQYVKDYQPLVTSISITDSMSYAWKSVWQNDLFSWTNDTFLKEPFVYITDLFSIPSDNVLINALSYWLDISIIWLVFDVIMYVPLLTHRWLDKGIVE